MILEHTRELHGDSTSNLPVSPKSLFCYELTKSWEFLLLPNLERKTLSSLIFSLFWLREVETDVRAPGCQGHTPNWDNPNPTGTEGAILRSGAWTLEPQDDSWPERLHTRLGSSSPSLSAGQRECREATSKFGLQTGENLTLQKHLIFGLDRGRLETMI